MNKNTTKSNILSTGVSLLALFCLFFFADFLKQPLPLDLKCVDSKSLFDCKKPVGIKKYSSQESLITKTSTTKFKDSTIFIKARPIGVPMQICEKDTSIKSVLLIGDSQVEFLKTPIYNYCLNNNYKLVASIAWYSSTTAAWATGDTLEKFIIKYKPDFVIIVLGLNELFIKNMEPRRKYIETITNTITAQNIPYYWIGPAAWTKDEGITSLMQEELDTLFYPSQKLILARASDKRHPSMEASRIWFDSVAVAMTHYTSLSFINKVQEYKKPEHSPLIGLGITKVN